MYVTPGKVHPSAWQAVHVERWDAVGVCAGEAFFVSAAFLCVRGQATMPCCCALTSYWPMNPYSVYSKKLPSASAGYLLGIRSHYLHPAGINSRRRVLETATPLAPP